MLHFLAFINIGVVEVWVLIVLMVNMRSELVTIEENMFVCFCFFQKHSYCTEIFYHASSFMIAGDVEILPYFYGPVGILLLINLTLFAATARELTCGLWKREVVKSNTERYRTVYFIYLYFHLPLIHYKVQDQLDVEVVKIL